MKSIKLLLAGICLVTTGVQSQDWKGMEVPAQAPPGMIWELNPVSDSFDYESSSKNLHPEFEKRWKELYINNFSGPSLTSYHKDHSWITNGMLNIHGAWDNTLPIIYTGCISSKATLSYPMYMEAKVKQAGCMLANNIWMISGDETEELDMLESYPNQQEGKEFLDERIHLSHHTFIRQPFTDYQPRDEEGVFGTWYYETGKSTWRDDFFTIGVYWVNPHEAQYFINGKLVRTIKKNEHNFIDPDGDLSEHTTTFDALDKYGYTGGTGLSKPQHIIINMEQQDWLSDLDIYPTKEDLNDANSRNTYLIDWIRVYDAIPVGGKIPVTGVTITTKNVTIRPGETFQMEAIVTPANATKKVVSWTTSNSEIAIVNGRGLVKGLSQGTVTAEIETQDGNIVGITTVTVAGTPVGPTDTTIAVDGVSIYPRDSSIEVGKTFNLRGSVIPFNATIKSISWASSNSSVAVIDNLGTVTAISEGVTIITASSLEGGKTDVITITVTDDSTDGDTTPPDTISVTGINISTANTTLNIDQTRPLSSTISPSDATNKNVSWSSNNTNIATVNNLGVVSAIAAGTAIITVTSEDGLFTDTIPVIVNAADTSNPSKNKIIIEAETFTATGGTFNDSEFSGPGLGVSTTARGIEFVNSGDYVEYTINVANAGEYTLEYLIATLSKNAEIQIAINGSIVTTDSVKNTGDWNNYNTLTSSNVITLNAGVQSVKITASGTNVWQWNLDKVILKQKNDEVPSPVVNGGVLTGSPFIFTVGDGIDDNVSGIVVTGNLGTTSKWVITDEASNILSIPETLEAFDFDDSGVGVSLIWNISYEAGLVGLNVGKNISDLRGIYDLSSNSIRVERKAPTSNQNATLVIEAEDFDATGGVFNDTQFGGSGLGVNRAAPRINYVNEGDWAEYTIDIAIAGTYTIEYSISTPSDNAQIQMTVDGANITSTNVPNNGAWENFASVSGGSVILSKGSHLIRIDASGNNIWQWNLDKITLSTGRAFSPKIASNKNESLRLRLYPNPSSDKVFILGLNDKIDYEIQVYDITGAKRQVTIAQNNSINIENLAAGIYFVTVVNSLKETKTARFVKN